MATTATQEALELLAQGGFTMGPLIAFAVVLWYGLGYRALTLWRGSSVGLRALVRLYRAAPARTPRGLIDAAVLRGVALTQKHHGTRLRRALAVAFGDIAREAGRCRALVQAVVVAAPLTGLLGTVSGMIETFDSLGQMALYTQSGGIAGGISEALFSTQMGLAVAIPGLVIGRLLARREERLLMELDTLTEVLLGTQETAA